MADDDPQEEGDGLRRALAELRREIHARLRPADEAVEGESIDWMELFEQLRRRVNTLGMDERSGEVDEFGMDEVVLRRAASLLDFLVDQWWRVAVSGLDDLPGAGPCLLVANGSGLLPWDGLVVSHVVARQHPAHVRPRFLVADWLVTLPFVQPILASVGGVRACRENAERLLRRGGFVLTFPEGVKGAAKPFRQRYRLQRFGRGGVMRLAIEQRVPVVPVAVVGAEETHPILFKWSAPARALGLPFLPVTPTFPWLGPLGLIPLPSKWSLHFGEPMSLDHLEPEAAEDELLVSRLNEELRERIQAMVSEAVGARPSVWG